MGQANEREIEIVAEFTILQLLRLRKAFPDTFQVRRKRVLQVDQRRCADVVADDEEKQSPLILTDKEAWVIEVREVMRL